MSDRAADLIWILGCMVLVGSALLAQRCFRRPNLLRMALVWVAIFALLFGVALWIDYSPLSANFT